MNAASDSYLDKWLERMASEYEARLPNEVVRYPAIKRLPDVLRGINNHTVYRSPHLKMWCVKVDGANYVADEPMHILLTNGLALLDADGQPMLTAEGMADLVKLRLHDSKVMP